MTTRSADAAAVVPPGVETLTGDRCARWSVAGALPRAVAFPTSLEQASAILRAASEADVPVATAGAGEWLGARAERPVELVVSAARMDELVHYEPADLTLTAQAGLSLAAVASAAARARQWLALDPPGSGTLGGLVATGSAGPLQMAFGRPRDHVLGLTLVTGDGRVLKLGGRVVKNVAGFDLVKLAVGSWGVFGLITSVCVRLHALPAQEDTLVYRGALSELVPLASALAHAPVVPASLELVRPDPTIKGPEAGPFVAVRLLGTRGALTEAGELMKTAAGRRADERLQGSESAALAAVVREAGTRGPFTVRVRGPVPHMEAMLRETVETFASQGVVAAHVSEGEVRAAAPSAPTADAWPGFVERIGELGGRVTVLTGPDRTRADGASRSAAGEAGVGRLLAGLKAEFDPAGILWPGRFQRWDS